MRRYFSFFYFFKKIDKNFFLSHQGPGTKFEARVAANSQPINKLDSACFDHDLAYHENKDLKNRHAADKILAKAARARIFARDASLGEKISAATVSGLIGIKHKLGMGAAPKKRRTKTRRRSGRKIPQASHFGGSISVRGRRRRRAAAGKRGGFLPFVAPIAAGIGALATLYKTSRDLQASKKMLQETERHDKEMEKIASGLHLKPHPRRGRGLSTRKRRGCKKRRV